MLSFNANPPQETFVIQFPPHIKYLFFIAASTAKDGRKNSSHIFFQPRIFIRKEEKQIQRETWNTKKI